MKKRRGFTLVELLVVIAILAVLATITILGYSAFIGKAETSNDIAVVKQMNNILMSHETLEKKARNCDEAVKQCYDGGFIFENLTPTNRNNCLVYDGDNNRFALLDNKLNIVYEDTNKTLTTNTFNTFMVINDNNIELAGKEYGTYFGKAYFDEIEEQLLNINDKYEIKDAEENIVMEVVLTGLVYQKDENNKATSEVISKELTINVKKSMGIDLGENDNYVIINYEPIDDGQKHTVIIRTYGGELNINAPNDTIYHYDFASEIVIDDVDDACYYEYGRVGRLTYNENLVENEEDSSKKVSGGKIIFCNTADVSCYMNKSDDEAANATNENKEEGAVVYTWTSVETNENYEVVERTINTLLTDASGEEATFHTKAEANESKDTDKKVYMQFDETTGNVVVNACSHHNKDYRLETIGESTYIVCDACGAYSLYNGKSANSTPTQSSKEIETEQAKETTDKSRNNDITFNTIAVSSISVNKTSLTLVIGNNETLLATINPDNASIKSVVWASSDDTIATVDQNGVVTAIKKGDCVITVTSLGDGEKKAACTVTVVKNSSTCSHSWDIITSNKNGTHTIKCSKCNNSYKENCNQDDDGACSKCGYVAFAFVTDKTTLGSGETLQFETTIDSKDIKWDWECYYYDKNDVKQDYTNDVKDYTEFENGALTSYVYGVTYTIKATLGKKTIAHDIKIIPFHEPINYVGDPFVIANETQMSNYFNYLVYGGYTYLSWASYGYSSYTTTVKLVSDIDMSKVSYTYTCTGIKSLVFDGNGHTISNGTRELFNGNYLTGTVTIKDLTLKNCTSNYGLFTKYGEYSGNITFDNVDLIGCTAKGGCAYVPYAYYNGDVVTFKNCDVKDCLINDVNGAQGFVGIFVGNSKPGVTVDSCSVESTIVSASKYAVGGLIGSYQGTIKNTNVKSNCLIEHKDSNVVYAFGGGTIIDSYFYGTVKSNTLSQAYLQKTNAVWVCANPIATGADFVLNANGSITYTGSETLTKIIVQQKVTCNHLKDGVNDPNSGGYPYSIESGYGNVFNNVSKDDILDNAYSKITNLRQVGATTTTALNYNLAELPLGLEFNEYDVVVDNGILYLDSATHNTSYETYVSGAAANENGPINVTVFIEIYDTQDVLLTTATMSYSFQPTN